MSIKLHEDEKLIEDIIENCQLDMENWIDSDFI